MRRHQLVAYPLVSWIAALGESQSLPERCLSLGIPRRKYELRSLEKPTTAFLRVDNRTTLPQQERQLQVVIVVVRDQIFQRVKVAALDNCKGGLAKLVLVVGAFRGGGVLTHAPALSGAQRHIDEAAVCGAGLQ